MKLACVVLFISLAAASVAQLQATAPRPDVCHTDLECKLAYGNQCFCLNPGHLQSHGQCICNMDTDFLNVCVTNEECWRKQNKLPDAFYIYCGCIKKNFNDRTGHCGCV